MSTVSQKTNKQQKKRLNVFVLVTVYLKNLTLMTIKTCFVEEFATVVLFFRTGVMFADISAFTHIYICTVFAHIDDILGMRLFRHVEAFVKLDLHIDLL